MTDSKPETRRTAPTPDAPEGYEYTPASAEVHKILGRRFDAIRDTAIHPTKPGVLLYHVGNFWDGPSEVRDNGDGSYTYRNPYNGDTDRFDATGYWTRDGEHKPWSTPETDRPGYWVRAGEATHTVDYADARFTCRDCGANGLADGHPANRHGAQDWHDATTA